jgi:hypothetical protein
LFGQIKRKRGSTNTLIERHNEKATQTNAQRKTQRQSHPDKRSKKDGKTMTQRHKDKNAKTKTYMQRYTCRGITGEQQISLPPSMTITYQP